MSLFLSPLGHGIGRRRVLVVVVWLVLLVAALAGARTLGTHYDNTFSIPGNDSQQGQDVLASRFPIASGASGQIVFTTTDGGDDDVTTAKTEIEKVLDRVGDLDAVSSVTDPFADGQSGSVSKDGEAVLATVQFDTMTPTTEQQDAVQSEVATADGGVEAVVLGDSAQHLLDIGADKRNSFTSSPRYWHTSPGRSTQ
ncbi:MMPL family transporter [Curtobacterium pusillum]|uniref:MMPL family transporter n=1 Tax=Curtobacterium pusillum TaxID=69373 RepID=UPI00381F8857